MGQSLHCVLIVRAVEDMLGTEHCALLRPLTIMGLYTMLLTVAPLSCEWGYSFPLQALLYSIV